ncbi:hypothetical protein GYMLUDRAFT_245325 [Collybiopsis luxurians FD-317 M1]|uniref:Unplaced genomic scaffold GYMLUscaffold_32, whole genome shotgun sequence n=1 Tax=Collybiopsis luxurians FD-317 M1 TaxID=944289 RepID=A0A0D0BUR7_9AGAR|nr:hypothetical protein GYMLUDRAFT_245325 [Collybiopsis luxurians FD-317 M1]
MSSNASALPNLLVFPEDRQLVGLSNWAIFRDHLQSVAQSTGLSGYLDGTIIAPASPAAGAVSAPAVAPSAAAPMLTATPINSYPQSIRVPQDMTAHQMWTRLTSEYNMTSAVAQSLAKEHIQQYKYVPGTPFEEYFKQLEALCKAASNVGCTVGDKDLHSCFLTSLSLDHLWILQTNGACSYCDLKCALLEYDMMVELANSSAATSATAPNALIVAGKSNASNKN